MRVNWQELNSIERFWLIALRVLWSEQLDETLV
jgi:hypothetical protein